MKKITSIALILLTLCMVGCSKNVSPNVYDASELGVKSKVVHGVVISKRLVKLNSSTDKGVLPGAVAGGAVGASLGSSIGHVSPALGFSVFALSAVTGAVLGGVTGDAIDKAINNQQAYEYEENINQQIKMKPCLM